MVLIDTVRDSEGTEPVNLRLFVNGARISGFTPLKPQKAGSHAPLTVPIRKGSAAASCDSRASVARC